MRTRLVRPLALFAVALTLASCSHSARRSGAPATTAAPPFHETLVSIGSTATIGVGLARPFIDSWPQKLFHESFPRSTVFVNAADPPATVQLALAQPLSIALEVHATVVAIWLGDVDFAIGVPVATFEARLDQLVGRLRDSGARVLLGTLSRATSAGAAYDAVIARVARVEGANLVDLDAALGAPAAGPSDSVNAATSEKIARAFGAAVARA